MARKPINKTQSNYSNIRLLKGLNQIFYFFCFVFFFFVYVICILDVLNATESLPPPAHLAESARSRLTQVRFEPTLGLYEAKERYIRA